MVFASINFLFLFLPVFLFVYFIFPFRRYRNFVLFFFSLIFYAWGEPVYVFLMIFSIFINYSAALLMEVKGTNRRVVLIAGITFNLLLLGIFKYLDFFIHNFNLLFKMRVHSIHLLLPIGVSFYTFQLISYIVDVYAGRSKVQNNFITLGAYLAGFPQLVAGPIVRYQTIAEELFSRRENIQDFTSGIRRFIVGLAKKVIIGNNMAFVVDAILKELPVNYGAVGAWIILLAYALQIYYDFSGYSDMAIGMGRMLGFHYLENFNYPYIARSVTDFWRRWHISLTTFFREYAYIPLGGNRAGMGRVVINILIVWCLTGLWHGAAWNYVIWGIYYGIILVFEKLLPDRLSKRIPVFCAHIYVILAFLIGWALFKIEDIIALKGFLGTLAGANGVGHMATFVYSRVLQVHLIVIFIIGVIFCMPIALRMEKFFYATRWKALVADIWLSMLLVISTGLLISGVYNPFIYFRF